VPVGSEMQTITRETLDKRQLEVTAAAEKICALTQVTLVEKL
jgi:hypothetical protein